MISLGFIFCPIAENITVIIHFQGLWPFEQPPTYCYFLKFPEKLQRLPIEYHVHIWKRLSYCVSVIQRTWQELFENQKFP